MSLQLHLDLKSCYLRSAESAELMVRNMQTNDVIENTTQCTWRTKTKAHSSCFALNIYDLMSLTAGLN